MQPRAEGKALGQIRGSDGQDGKGRHAKKKYGASFAFILHQVKQIEHIVRDIKGKNKA